MVQLKPAKLRSIARKWATGRLLLPRLERFWQGLLGWLGLAVLIWDAGVRWVRAVIANGRKAWSWGIRECGRVAGVWAARRGRMSASWARRGARARIAWSRRRAKVVARWAKRATAVEGRAWVRRVPVRRRGSTRTAEAAGWAAGSAGSAGSAAEPAGEGVGALTVSGRARESAAIGQATGQATGQAAVPQRAVAKGRATVPSRTGTKGGPGGGPERGWAEEDNAKRGKVRRSAGRKKRKGRKVSAERGAAERNALSWGKVKRGKVTVPPLKAYRRGLTRWMAARRPSGGWRVAAGWATGICTAAGLGILLGALTLQPPRPPQPAPQALPSQVQGSGVALPRSLPTRIEIPAIGVDAGLLSLGVDDKDELVVPPPDRAELASWYNLGPSPGEGGSAVIVGHVDSAKIGPAVFFNLGRLKPGDVITVTRKDGTRPSFKVDSVQTFLKTSFPTRLVYEGEQATLRVITCGGEFDKTSRSYRSNVVVFASLDT